MTKRFNSNYYSKYKRKNGLLQKDENGYLFACGRYPTKITEEDLPEWYVDLYIYGSYGYLSSKGVQYLFFKPLYFFPDHFLKDDILYISYSKPIRYVYDKEQWGHAENYEALIYGTSILHFLDFVEKYSPEVDTREIRAEIEKKRHLCKEYDENKKVP